MLGFFRGVFRGPASCIAREWDGIAAADDVPHRVSDSVLRHAHGASLPASDRSVDDDSLRVRPVAIVARDVSAPGDGAFANYVSREIKHNPPK